MASLQLPSPTGFPRSAAPTASRPLVPFCGPPVWPSRSSLVASSLGRGSPFLRRSPLHLLGGVPRAVWKMGTRRGEGFEAHRSHSPLPPILHFQNPGMLEMDSQRFVTVNQVADGLIFLRIVHLCRWDAIICRCDLGGPTPLVRFARRKKERKRFSAAQP